MAAGMYRPQDKLITAGFAGLQRGYLKISKGEGTNTAWLGLGTKTC